MERLDLAAATSATVAVAADGTATVVSTGGDARVVSGVLTAPEGTSVEAGKPIALAGTGLPAGATLQVVLRSDPVVVGRLAVRADGTATGSVTIPAGTTAGAHTLDLVDASGASVLVSPLRDHRDGRACHGGTGPEPGTGTGGTGTGDRQHRHRAGRRAPARRQRLIVATS